MLGEKQRPVRIKLMDGESVRGWIEYYDRRMVRLTREGAPNLFIFKHEIAYIAEDTVRKPRAESPSRRTTAMPRAKRMSRYLPEVEAIAREAGALLMGYFARRVTIEYKGDVDLVTAADRASEKLIVERLRARWPEHEHGGRGRHAAARLAPSIAGTSTRWMAPPISPTAIPCSASRSRWFDNDEQLEVGVLYDPTRDEMFAAERGQGATLNGKPIHVSKTSYSCGIASGDRLSQPQAAQESQYSLLSPAHLALARSSSRRFGGARSGQCCLRPLRRILGVQSQSVGYRCRRASGAGSRRNRHALRWLALSPRQPRGAGQQWPHPSGTASRISRKSSLAAGWKNCPRPVGIRQDDDE